MAFAAVVAHTSTCHMPHAACPGKAWAMAATMETLHGRTVYACYLDCNAYHSCATAVLITSFRYGMMVVV